MDAQSTATAEESSASAGADWPSTTLSTARSFGLEQTISASASAPTVLLATSSPTLPRPLPPPTLPPSSSGGHGTPASITIGIPLGISLGGLVLLLGVLFWLGKNDKLVKWAKCSPYQNPYTTKARREAQVRRLEEVQMRRWEREGGLDGDRRAREGPVGGGAVDGGERGRWWGRRGNGS